MLWSSLTQEVLLLNDLARVEILNEATWGAAYLTMFKAPP